MVIGVCAKCGYQDLIDDSIDNICPRCSGNVVSLGIRSDVWNSLSKEDKQTRVNGVVEKSIPKVDPSTKEDTTIPPEKLSEDNLNNSSTPLSKDPANDTNAMPKRNAKSVVSYNVNQASEFTTDKSTPASNKPKTIADRSPKLANTSRSYEKPEKDYYDKISGLSITSFVLSFFIGIVGIILGIIDLTKDDGRKKGLSIAAISIGGVSLITLIGLSVFSFSTGSFSLGKSEVVKNVDSSGAEEFPLATEELIEDSPLSKEDLLKEYATDVEMSISGLLSEKRNNPVVAEERYKDKVIKTTGYVSSIKSGEIGLADLKDGSNSLFTVELSNDDILKIEQSQIITIIGIIKSIETQEIKNGYILNDNFEVVAQAVIEKVPVIGAGLGGRTELLDQMLLYSTGRNQVKLSFENYKDGIINHGTSSSVGDTYDYSELNGEVVKDGDLFDIVGKAYVKNGAVTFSLGPKITKHK